MLTIEPDAQAELADVIRTGIETEEPHAGDRGPGPFSGTYDWHSCVHAHWALLAMEKFGAPVDDWLHARLSSAVLEVEFGYLQDNPTFELPYGRAWLLLLINELRRQVPSDSALESLNGRLQMELQEYLKTHPGLQTTLLLMNGAAGDFLFAAKLKGQAGIVSTQMLRSPGPNVHYSACLASNIQKMFETGRPPYPVERTLLVSGILDRAFDSLAGGSVRLETPALDVCYTVGPEPCHAHA